MTLGDLALLKEKMHEADIFCDATALVCTRWRICQYPGSVLFPQGSIVTDTVYAPRGDRDDGSRPKEVATPVVIQRHEHDAVQALIAIELYGKINTGLHERRSWES